MAVHLETGCDLHGYIIKRFLGGGGEGDAYLAMGPDEREVVVKQINESVKAPSAPENLERLYRLRDLQGHKHPNWAEILRIFEHEDLPYIITTYCKGKPLSTFMEERGPCSLRLVDAITRDLLSVMDWLHKLGYVHRDLKPDNVIVDVGADRVHATLIDPGIALALGRTRVTRRSAPCTPAYAAPEFLMGTDMKIDGRADLHSAGTMFFELLTGELPFAPERPDFYEKLASVDPRPSPCAHDPGIPSAVGEFVRKMYALHPADRYANAAEALGAWQEAYDGEPAPPPVEDDVPIIDPEPDPGGLPVPVPYTPTSFEPDPIGPAFPVGPFAPAPCPSPPAPVGPGGLVPSGLIGRPPGLHVLTGEHAGMFIPLPSTRVALGRVELNPRDELMSRSHITARLRGSVLVLEARDAVNGLLHGGQRKRRIRLHPGEHVTIGTTNVVYINNERRP